MKATGAGLSCVACGGRILAVKDSRRSHSCVRRRRHCLSCGKRMTTYEMMSGLDDDRDLGKAVQLWDKLRAMPDRQRDAIIALINASAALALPTFAPPMIIEAKPADG